MRDEEAYLVIVWASPLDGRALHVCRPVAQQRYSHDSSRRETCSNKNILVCWHHGKIPELLASIGADPQKLLPPKGKWPEDVFGWFVRLEYDQNGNLNVKVQDEDLMPGDAANPPQQVKSSPMKSVPADPD